MEPGGEMGLKKNDIEIKPRNEQKESDEDTTEIPDAQQQIMTSDSSESEKGSDSGGASGSAKEGSGMTQIKQKPASAHEASAGSGGHSGGNESTVGAVRDLIKALADETPKMPGSE